MIAMYRHRMEDQYTDLTGFVYSELRTLKNDHPYFPSSQWITGSIVYGGRYIDNLPLRFDAVGQTLVTQLKNETMIALVTEKLKSFSIDDHHFEWIDAQLSIGLPSSGFYEVVYNGVTKLVCFREKIAQKAMVSQVYTTVDTRTDKLYYERHRYYALSGNEFHPVSGKSSLLNLLKSEKKELKKFGRQRHLDFRNKHDAALSAILKYYDSLKK